MLASCKPFHPCPRSKKAGLYITQWPLETGFQTDHLLVFAEPDIFGQRLSRPQSKRGRGDDFLREVSALETGDLVVHAEHGILAAMKGWSSLTVRAAIMIACIWSMQVVTSCICRLKISNCSAAMAVAIAMSSDRLGGCGMAGTGCPYQRAGPHHGRTID